MPLDVHFEPILVIHLLVDSLIKVYNVSRLLVDSNFQMNAKLVRMPMSNPTTLETVIVHQKLMCNELNY